MNNKHQKTLQNKIHKSIKKIKKNLNKINKIRV